MPASVESGSRTLMWMPARSASRTMSRATVRASTQYRRGHGFQGSWPRPLLGRSEGQAGGRGSSLRCRSPCGSHPGSACARRRCGERLIEQRRAPGRTTDEGISHVTLAAHPCVHELDGRQPLGTGIRALPAPGGLPPYADHSLTSGLFGNGNAFADHHRTRRSQWEWTFALLARLVGARTPDRGVSGCATGHHLPRRRASSSGAR